eukprot:s1016_g1.t1
MDGASVTFVLQTVEFLSSVVGATGACIDHLEVPKDQGAARGGFFAVSPQSSPLASLGAAVHVREPPQPPFPEVPSCWVVRVRRSKTVEVPRGPRIQLPPGAIPIPERKACILRTRTAMPARRKEASSTLLGRLSLRLGLVALRGIFHIFFPSLSSATDRCDEEARGRMLLLVVRGQVFRFLFPLSKPKDSREELMPF